MKLYELTEAMKALEAWATDEELTQNILETLEGAEEEKIEGMVKLIRSFKADAESFKAEAASFTAKAKAAANAAERVQDLIAQHMSAVGKDKIKTPLFTVSYGPAGGVAPLVIREGEPLEFAEERFIKRVESWDSSKIKEALDAGEKLEFAWYGERKNVVRIR